MLRQPRKHQDEDRKSSSNISNLPINKFDTENAHYVIVINGEACTITAEWIVEILLENGLTLSIITDEVEEGKDGDVNTSKPNQKGDLILLVSCDYERLERMSTTVYMRQQLARQSAPGTTRLSMSEQQRVLLNLLEGIHSVERTALLGMPNVTIYHKQSIVQICRRENVILDYFPLHDFEELSQFKRNYFFKFNYDFDSIRNYFGETIGFYFAFLNAYQYLFVAVTPLAMISFWWGHLYAVTELSSLAICFGLFIFLKLWTRYSNRLASRWGTIDAFELNNARLDFRCKSVVRDPMTEELEPYYPISKTWYKEYLISMPFVIFSFFLAFWIMSCYFEAERSMLEYYKANSTTSVLILTYVPSISYALVVMALNYIYRSIATQLNEYENHRTQISHENHWIVKMVLFEFANNFMSLFYIAFYLADIEMLKWNLLTMLVINQIADNVLEALIPAAKIYLSKKLRALEKTKKDFTDQQAAVLYQKELETYTDTYYDYLEMFNQFGYSFLFVSVFPLAPLIALVNSCLEIRIDAIKFCFLTKRPFQRSAKAVNNSWIKAFITLAFIAVLSNLMIMSYLSPMINDLAVIYNYTNFQLAICFEHVLLAIIFLMWSVVPDVPKDIFLFQMKQKYANLKEVIDKASN